MEEKTSPTITISVTLPEDNDRPLAEVLKTMLLDAIRAVDTPLSKYYEPYVRPKILDKPLPDMAYSADDRPARLMSLLWGMAKDRSIDDDQWDSILQQVTEELKLFSRLRIHIHQSRSPKQSTQ